MSNPGSQSAHTPAELFTEREGNQGSVDDLLYGRVITDSQPILTFNTTNMIPSSITVMPDYRTRRREAQRRRRQRQAQRRREQRLLEQQQQRERQTEAARQQQQLRGQRQNQPHLAQATGHYRYRTYCDSEYSLPPGFPSHSDYLQRLAEEEYREARRRRPWLRYDDEDPEETEKLLLLTIYDYEKTSPDDHWNQNLLEEIEDSLHRQLFAIQQEQDEDVERLNTAERYEQYRAEENRHLQDKWDQTQLEEIESRLTPIPENTSP